MRLIKSFAWLVLIVLFSGAPARPDASSNDVVNGSEKLRAGDIAGAEAELRAAVSLGTSDPQAYNLLGFICDRTNRSDEALAQYQRALALNPAFVPAHNNLGAFYLRQGNPDQALAQFQSSLKISPDDVTAHYNIAIINAQQGKLAAALESMKRARDYAPNDISIVVVLIKLQTQARDDSGAVESADQLLQLLRQNQTLPDSKQAISETIEALTYLSDKTPVDEKKLFLLAEFQFLAKEYSRVLSTLNRISENHRDVDYYNLLGMTQAGAGRFPQARAALAKAIAMAPHRADLLFNMGSVYQSARDNRTAIKLFKRAIAEGDSSTETEFALALGYFNFGNYEEAISTCLEIAKVNPTFDQALLLLGRSYAGMSKNEEAAAAIRRALAVNPECEQCYLHLSLVLLDMGNDAEATVLLRKVIQINPSNASAHFQLGKTLAKQKENTKAIEELQRAIELEPKQDLAYYQLGHLYLAMGDRSRGETYLSTARTLKEARRSAAQTEMSKQH